MLEAITLRPSPRSAALRVFGAVGVLFVALLVVLLFTRPEMVISVMHAVMNLMP